MKFVDYDSSSLLQLFNNEYLQKMRASMIIGSEEYTLSAIFSYALAVLVNSMNKGELNRFIDTAEGQYLDAIASAFNLSRVRNAPSNAKVDIKVNTGSAPAQIEIAGMEFTKGMNVGRFYQYISSIPLQRVSPSIDDLTSELHEDHANLDACSEIYPKGYYEDDEGNPLSFPYTKDGDNAFREYIKSHNAITKGTAAYFEQLSMDSHANLRDVYVLRPKDSGYVSGTVSMLLLPHEDENSDYDSLIIAEVLEVLRSPENHALGQDIFDINVCGLANGPVRYYNLSYGSKFNRMAVVDGEQRNIAQLHASIIKAFYARKIYKINTPYSDVEFINLLSSDIMQNQELMRFIVDEYGQDAFNAIADVKADNVSRVNSIGISIANDITYPASISLVSDCIETVTTYISFRY